VSPDLSPSLLALLLQAVGLAPLAVLSFLLNTSIRRDYLRYFWRAWTALVVALLCLFVALRFPVTRPFLEPVYFCGEYVFGAFLLAGCGNLATGARYGRRGRWLALPAAALAVVLAHAHPEFTARFIPQAGLMAVFFGLSLRALSATPPEKRGRVGTPLLQLSLGSLALLFAHYVPVLAWSHWTGATLPRAYAAYTSLFDLLFETLLGFGTLIVVLEREHAELGLVNAELRAARERLEVLARVDPLTSSLNRHAFYSMVEGSRSDEGAAGCVAVADIDGLKLINDSLGHSAGDAAIRAVARAIRQLVRADDLVFRWGGDEFLAVLFGVTEEEARRRLDGLAEMLSAVPIAGDRQTIAVGVSVGLAPFASVAELEQAIDRADARMYRGKGAGRAPVVAE